MFLRLAGPLYSANERVSCISELEIHSEGAKSSHQNKPAQQLHRTKAVQLVWYLLQYAGRYYAYRQYPSISVPLRCGYRLLLMMPYNRFHRDEGYLSLQMNCGRCSPE